MPQLRYDIDSLDNRDLRLIDRLFRRYHRPLMRYYRARVFGLERIPPGPGLSVGNHNSAILIPDSFIFGAALYRDLGPAFVPYGLTHEWTLRLPLVHQLLPPLGAVRASHENALRLFDRGHKVLVYPGGELDSMRPFRQRDQVVFGGRKGYIRLALSARVPILPVVAAGAHATYYIVSDMRWLARLLRLHRSPLRTRAWPLTLSIPWGLTPWPPLIYVPWPTRIWIEALPPITLRPDGPAAAQDEAHVARCDEHVRQVIQRALTRLAARRAAA